MASVSPVIGDLVNTTARRVRISDVARMANVSRAAASKVLLGTGGANTRVAEKTAERIRTVALQMEYKPNLVAQTLAGKRTRVIGAVVDVFAGPSATRQLQEIDRVATLNNYRLLVGYVHDHFEKIAEFADDFFGREVEGVLCMAHHYSQFGDRVFKLFERFTNCVFVPAPIVDVDVSYVSVDFRKLSYLAASHLLKLGRRRLVLVRRKGSVGHVRTVQWDEGFRDAHRELGLSVEPWQFVLADSSLIDRPHLARGIADDVVDRQADGCITTNETSAMWLLGELRRRGVSVPNKVALVSCQREPFGWASDIRLTSVDRRDRKIAALATRCLLRHIEMPPDEPRPVERFTVQPRLVLGDSCGGRPAPRH